MFDFKKKFPMGRKECFKEAYKYAANRISDISKKENKKIFAVTSSVCGYNFCRNVMEKICQELADRNKKVLIVNADVQPIKHCNHSDSSCVSKDNIINLINASPEEFQSVILKNSPSYDIIFAVIPSVIYSADALEYAKICEDAVLIEKYTVSKYSNYENAIIELEKSKIKIHGVITVCE